ncbi:4-diphosphocytidyl-2-C-methyl-D-erythritol kinase [Novipirellula galeiformis]|uniref:4-diphosphocytidyl-2-C-methyl-D-erythritol kinase n=1 Tax=Novipirellula galeiformis TaxID=2528004 RepID=A0A5C6CK30_9BACT|nr:4-(cytidine 5'-diphospho)-2-C-methyl-D-erythritol kinase [Novipirellula galeiformis]TWU23169.1 4-diphosphocytidyl-2-C-methyl-D-erythritol kinase [Novipirellula galeiformis]
MHALPLQSVAVTHPPAKLNLFFELLGKRDDGYHDIDTIMVAIDWHDQLRLQQRPSPGIELIVDWMPSLEIIARELGVDPQSEHGQSLLAIPADERNLVHRALTRFVDHFGFAGGFCCHLSKSIPAGAGMGGASSDAASALRCAATLAGIPLDHPDLRTLASEIGSDVPFFLGNDTTSWTAARATGRGEQITPVSLATELNAVIAFPAISLSTATVYSQSSVPTSPSSANDFIKAANTGILESITSQMCNRLQETATQITPQIDEILKSMWRLGLLGCQLTGSGSACFGLADSAIQAKRLAEQLRRQLGRDSGSLDKPRSDSQISAGARVVAATSVRVPAIIQIESIRSPE